MSRYAAQTSVSANQSRNEIERLIERYGWSHGRRDDGSRHRDCVPVRRNAAPARRPSMTGPTRFLLSGLFVLAVLGAGVVLFGWMQG